MKYDYLIIGAGFAGAVCAERIANELGAKCLVVEKRNHIAGQCYDYRDPAGILVHKYGPHIFHTQAKHVWDYLSKFTSWTEYNHRVLGVVEGKNIPIPFNLNSIYDVFPSAYAEKLENLLIANYGYGLKIPILKLKETADPDLKFLADYIYNNVFAGYTKKQWGLKPEELDFSVTSRIPVYISRDDRYFQDRYQGIPSLGYTRLFENILNNKNIHLLLNADYREVIENIEYDKLIYTGPIDSFFDYRFGKLPYRSLEFELKSYNTNRYQAAAQINYPNNYDFTRITEFAHFLNQNLNATTIAFEYPVEYVEGVNDPYYPIPKPENDELYALYKAEADKLAGKTFFVGRLAEYKYYNMDQVIAVALMAFEKQIVPAHQMR